MMPAMWSVVFYALVIGAGWLALAVLLALVVGGGIRIADEKEVTRR